RNQSVTVDIIVTIRYQAPMLGNITGRILDEDNKPISDAQVNLEGENFFKTTRSDTAGKFSFEEVPEGNYLIRITKAGFKQKLVSANVRLGLETPIGDITVKREVKEVKSDDSAYAIIFGSIFAIVLVILAFMILHHKKKEDEKLEKEFLKPEKEDAKDKSDTKDGMKTDKEPKDKNEDEDEIDEGPFDDEEDKEEVPITNEEEAEVDDSVICLLCNSVISSKEQTYSCDCGKVMHDECASKAGKCPKCNARYIDK
ncbi:MAG: carboxypeptidase regulatory-like domain-containing protein, partial [Thermoplasmata archaeon]